MFSVTQEEEQEEDKRQTWKGRGAYLESLGLGEG